MPRVVPSEVVRAIDEWFPWAKDWTLAKTNERAEARFAAVTWLPGIVGMIEEVPDELLVFAGKDTSDFLIARAALQREVRLLATSSSKESVDWPMLKTRDCVEIIRNALAKCPDEGPAASASNLAFIKDPLDAALRDTLQTDLGSVERALSNGEWKAATVLAGSVIEALLLWVINQSVSADINAAAARAVASKRLNKAPALPAEGREWGLHQYIEVTLELTKITDDTATGARLSKDFRDLIHPGRAERTGTQCDRGTAHSAYGALNHVIKELAAKHP